MRQIEKLLEWLDRGTCNFLAVDTIKKELKEAGFTELRQSESWQLTPGAKYFMTKNDSAIFAFILGKSPVKDCGFRIISAHSDSPCFKIKPNAVPLEQLPFALSLI